MQLVILPLSLLLLPLGDQLALLAFGPEWSGAGEALKALCLLGVGMSWTSLASEALKAVGRPAVITRVHLVSFAASVVLIPAFVLVPWWPDTVGVALAVTAAALAAGVFALHHGAAAVRTTLGHLLRRLDRALVACVIALVATGAADLYAFGGEDGRGAAAVTVAAESVLFAAAYLFVLRAVAPGDFGRLGGVLTGVRGRRAAVGA
jgi:O-antigen/teichoic acid export membrane protein